GNEAGFGGHYGTVPRQEIADWRAQVGLLIGVGAEVFNVMRRLERRLNRRGCCEGNIADVVVDEGLAPGESFARFENQHRLAVMIKGQKLRIRCWRLSDGCSPDHHPCWHSLHEARRLDSPAQPCIGEIVAEGVEARIKGHRGTCRSIT